MNKPLILSALILPIFLLSNFLFATKTQQTALEDLKTYTYGWRGDGYGVVGR